MAWPGPARFSPAAMVLAAMLFAAIELGLEVGPAGWLGASCAAALALGLAVAWAGAPIAGGLAALLLLGGTAQLHFTEPDWFGLLRLHPQGALDWLLLGAIAAEGLGAALVLARGKSVPGVLRRIGAGRAALLIALTTGSSAMLMRYVWLGKPMAYLQQLLLLGVLVLIHAAAVAAIARAPDLSRLSAPGRARRAPQLARHSPVLLALGATVLAATMARFAFHGAGLVEDETAYVFQAKTLAAGLLAAPPLPPGTAAAFRFYLLQSDAHGWYATTTPGFAAALVPGVWLGAPWLVNPVLGGAAVWLAHRFVARCADRWIAQIVAVLMASSPWLIETSGSLMTHALSLVLTLGAWLLLLAARDRDRAERHWSAAAAALLAGALFGWLFLTRSLEGVLVGGLSGAWLAYTVRLHGWRALLGLGLGCALVGGLVFAFDAHFTGDPLRAPLTAYLDVLWGPGRNAYGFGPRIGPVTQWNGLDLWPGHSPLEGLINTVSGVRSLSLDLLGWPIGSLALVWVWLIWDRGNAFARMMAVVAAAVIVAHFFYWYGDVYYIGPRYWYAGFVPLLVLSAYGLRRVIAAWRDAGAGEEAAPRILFVVAVLAFFATAIVTPWHGALRYAQRSARAVEIGRLARDPALANAVVFLDGKSFGAAAIRNDPLLRSGAPLFVRDLGPQANARVLAAFSGRRAVVWSAPAASGGDGTGGAAKAGNEAPGQLSDAAAHEHP